MFQLADLQTPKVFDISVNDPNVIEALNFDGLLFGHPVGDGWDMEIITSQEFVKPLMMKKHTLIRKILESSLFFDESSGVSEEPLFPNTVDGFGPFWDKYWDASYIKINGKIVRCTNSDPVDFIFNDDLGLFVWNEWDHGGRKQQHYIMNKEGHYRLWKKVNIWENEKNEHIKYLRFVSFTCCLHVPSI